MSTYSTRPSAISQADHNVKILLIGNSGVGKSSILLQYSSGRFVHGYCNTIGVDYKIKNITAHGQSVRLQVWDTAGQDRFKTITSSYYRGADAIIVVYDITDRESFSHVQRWLEEIDKYSGEATLKYIVGNKNDLEEKRQVTEQQGQQFAKQLNTGFRQTSARLATNIDSLFRDLVEVIVFPNGPDAPIAPKQPPKPHGSVLTQSHIQVERRQGKKESGCCEIY